MTTQKETLIVDVGGNALGKLLQMSKVLKENQEGWGANAELVNRFRGEFDDLTDQFKIFGERGTQIANMLEEISDPIKRSALASELWTKELGRSSSFMGKAETAVTSMKARIQAMPAAYKAAAVGAAAVGTAVVALGVKAVQYGTVVWKKYAQESERAKIALEGLESQTDATEKSIGKAIDSTLKVSEFVTGYSESVRQASDALSDWGVEQQNFAQIAAAVWGGGGFGSKMAEKIIEVGSNLLDAKVAMSKFAREMAQLDPDVESLARKMSDLRNTEVELFNSTRGLVEDVDALAGAFKNFERNSGIKNTNAALEEMIGNLDRLLNGGGGSGGGGAKKGGGGGGRVRDTAGFLRDVSARVQSFEDSLNPGANLPSAKGMALEATERGQSFEVAKPGLVASAEELEARLSKVNSGLEGLAEKFKNNADKIIRDSLAASEAEEMARAWTSATDEIVAGFTNVGLSALTMGAQVLNGTATLGELGRNFAGELGSLFKQVGTGLALSGLGLEALYQGNPAAAIGVGAGLAVLGAAMEGFAAPGAGGASKAKSSGKSELRDIAREFTSEREGKAEERQIVINLGTREFFRTLEDGRRRGQYGANA